MKAVGDLDGGGAPDLVVCGRGGPLVWYQNPSWTRRTLSTATGPAGSSTGIAIADVDGNGSPDVVLANGIWFANPRPGGDAVLDAWAPHLIDAAVAHDVALANLDDDQDLDVVKRHQGAAGNVIRVFRQDGIDQWTERMIPAPVGEGLALADLDADGDIDIAISSIWYENDGDPISGDWTVHTYSTSYTHAAVVVKVGDIGGSSRPDIVLSPAEAEGGTYRLSWFEAAADPKGIWTEHVLVDSIEAVVHSLVVADFDRDGRGDVAYAEMHQGADPDEVVVLLQTTLGAFTVIPVSSVGSHLMTSGDLDRDGRIDLFGANHDTQQAPDGAEARIWLNRLPVPEPAGADLLAVGLLASLAWRRHLGTLAIVSSARGLWLCGSNLTH